MVGRAALAASLGLLAAGCGGSSEPPSVAGLSTTTPTTTSGSTATPKPSLTAFASCMTAHGVLTESPGGHGVTIMSDPAPALMDAATAACRTLMPGGGPPAMTPAQLAKRTQQLFVFAKCMRAHGATSFPDPDSDGELPLDKLGAPDVSSPHLYSAYLACRSLFPRFGPQIRIAPAQ